MKQLTEGVCAESAVVSLWEGCGLRWEEDLGVKMDNLKDLLTREVLYICNSKNMPSSGLSLIHARSNIP